MKRMTMHGCLKMAAAVSASGLMMLAGLPANATWNQDAGQPAERPAEKPNQGSLGHRLHQQPGQEPARAAREREFRSADELLEALERADEGLVSLTAHVQYDRTSALADDHQVNIGRLYFITGLNRDRETVGNRKFAIQFNERIVDRVVRPEESMYIFDGEWLIEKQPRERLFIRRQVVPPGERFDPLRIGEGPMPLPIGQRREDIVQQYQVEMLDPLDGLDDDADVHSDLAPEMGQIRAFAQNAYQLRLVPHAHLAQQNDFREVRLWYFRSDDGNLLPRMARTVTRSEDESLVRLFDVQVQMAGAPVNPEAQVPPEVLNTRAPIGRDWHVQDTPWRGQAPAGEGVRDGR